MRVRSYNKRSNWTSLPCWCSRSSSDSHRKWYRFRFVRWTRSSECHGIVRTTNISIQIRGWFIWRYTLGPLVGPVVGPVGYSMSNWAIDANFYLIDHWWFRCAKHRNQIRFYHNIGPRRLSIHRRHTTTARNILACNSTQNRGQIIWSGKGSCGPSSLDSWAWEPIASLLD